MALAANGTTALDDNPRDLLFSDVLKFDSKEEPEDYETNNSMTEEEEGFLRAFEAEHEQDEVHEFDDNEPFDFEEDIEDAYELYRYMDAEEEDRSANGSDATEAKKYLAEHKVIPTSNNEKSIFKQKAAVTHVMLDQKKLKKPRQIKSTVSHIEFCFSRKSKAACRGSDFCFNTIVNKKLECVSQRFVRLLHKYTKTHCRFMRTKQACERNKNCFSSKKTKSCLSKADFYAFLAKKFYGKV